MPNSIPSNLSLNEDWALGEDAFQEIASNLGRLATLEHLVEFGSGRSTVRFALEFPQMKLTSIEHDEESYAQTVELVREHGVGDRVTLQFGKLQFIHRGGRTFLAYPKLDLPSTVDAAIIDGPPFYTLRGREDCLYAVFDRLKRGGLVVLDDYQRLGEQRMARNWFAVYHDAFEARVAPVGHHLLFLTKRQDVAPAWEEPNVRSDGERVGDKYKEIQTLLAGTTDASLAQASQGHRAFNARVWASIRAAYQTPAPEAPSEHATEDAAHLREIMKEVVQQNNHG